jgi:protein kinase
MERYKITKTIGDGTYGSVSQAVHRDTGQIVAIKQMKSPVRSWNECVNMREVKVLLHISHPNIVKMLEVIKNKNHLCLVFEFLDVDVYHLFKERTKYLSEIQIRNIIFQTLQGLAYMHSKGLFHRDLKPENLLIKDNTVKIADFGLVRDTRSQPPYTEYVSTRWYRAPEVLLRSPNYGPAIDIFALGALMAELYTFKPLFPGNGEMDQLYKICRIMGSPRTWVQGQRLAAQIGFRFPNEPGIPLQTLIPNANEHAINLMRAMMDYSAEARPTALDALRHPYFMTAIPVPRSLPSAEVVPQPPESTRPSELSNFSRQHRAAQKHEPRHSVYERMKQARYQPGQSVN